MARKELNDYVENSLKKGFSWHQIEAVLKKAGYSNEAISEVSPKKSHMVKILIGFSIIASIIIIVLSATLVTQITSSIRKQPIIETPKQTIKAPVTDYVKDDEICEALVKFEILNLGGKVRFCYIDDKPPKVQFMAHNFGKVDITGLMITANSWYKYEIPDTYVKKDAFLARMVTLDKQVKDVSKAVLSPIIIQEGKEIICQGIEISPVEKCK